MPDSREAHLLQLLRMERPVAELTGALASYPWDRAHDLVRLTVEHVSHALRRYADGHIGEADLRAWAVAVSEREDIDQDPTTGVGNVVNGLAHPERMAALTPQRAGRLAAQLRNDGDGGS
jgi:hypothetical protein